MPKHDHQGLLALVRYVSTLHAHFSSGMPLDTALDQDFGEDEQYIELP